MKNPHIVDRTPPSHFADRLEAEFLRAAGAATAPPSTRTDTPEEPIMTIDLDTPPTTHRRGNAWKLFALTAAAAALIVALTAILVRRDEDDTASAGGTPVSFIVHWAYSEVNGTCVLGSSTKCLNHFDIPAEARFDGDVDGSGFQAIYWNDPVDYPGRAVDHLEHIGTYRVQATVKGCGTGDFMLVELMQFVSGSERDRDTGTYKGTWQIVDGSGRDELSTIAGSGTSNGIFGTAGDVGRTFTGTVSCPTS